MDYTQLSDQQINMLVAEILHPEREVIESKSRPPSACVIGNLPSKWVDYCNNSADAWQIIVENRISIRNRCEGDWKAENEWGESFFHVACNPLRASMIVFLMMQESKNANS